MNPPKYPCPCCGYIVFSEQGVYEICPICGWEDDESQSRLPTMSGGANKMSLTEAQKNYKEFGAKDKEHMHSVRKPLPTDHRLG